MSKAATVPVSLLIDVLLLENLQQDLNRISDRIGKVVLPRSNWSGGEKDELRTRQNRDLVDRIYGPDRELYETIAALDNRSAILSENQTGGLK